MSKFVTLKFNSFSLFYFIIYNWIIIKLKIESLIDLYLLIIIMRKNTNNCQILKDFSGSSNYFIKMLKVFNVIKQDKITKKYYKPTIFIIIVYKSTITNKKDTIKRMRNLGTLNKFLNGAKITKIKPTKLLIKNRG